ncbi:MAG: hypothetical protein R3E01_22730 [Pirellulaceae bacterium]|nr:hypothetical protein [Planctomycetales bacterium]
MEHGGDVKFAKGSRTDKQFRRFLHDYAQVVSGGIRSDQDIPEPSAQVAVVAGQHLRVTNLPANLGGKLMRVTIHGKTDTGWSDEPAATADSTINRKQGIWQNPVFLLVPRDSQAARQILKERKLPGGHYLARLFIDRNDRLQANRDADFLDDDLFQEIEFDGQWQPGWREPKDISAGSK